MNHSVLTPSFLASGDIRPCRFVKISGKFTVAEASVANERCFGVSQEALRDTPIPGASTTLAASVGLPVGVYGPGETCLLEAGGAITAGALCKTDNQGRAVATVTALDIVMAIALEDQATTGGRFQAYLIPGTKV